MPPCRGCNTNWTEGRYLVGAEAKTEPEHLWRPRGDSNPRYRRESSIPWRKLLKLRNTDGCQKQFQ
jgi:hypothetical protein